MADSLSVELKASAAWLWEETLDLSTVVDSSRLEAQTLLAAGSGSGQANQIWHDTRTVAGESDDDLDLTALAQTVLGQNVSLAFASIKAILIQNTSAASGAKLVLDSSVANSLVTPFDGSATSKLQIPPDSPLLLVHRTSGWAVTADSGDILRISNPGTESVTYKIVIVGVKA